MIAAAADPAASMALGQNQSDALPLIASVTLSNPLTGPAAAQAALPGSADVTLHVVPVDPLPVILGPEVFKVNAVTVNGVTIDLSDGYALSVDTRDAAVFVTNAVTSERLRIWGTAEIQLAGADTARFWGTTSVILGNGAKITLETAADAVLDDVFRLDRLTVTQDDRALVITGVSSDQPGDLVLNESRDGYAIDDATRDGLTLIENTNGWTDEYGNAVTPGTLAQTAPDAPYGPGSTLLSLGEVWTAVRRFIVFGQVTSLSSLWSPSLQVEKPAESEAVRAARLAELQHLQISHPALAGRDEAFSNVTRATLT